MPVDAVAASRLVVRFTEARIVVEDTVQILRNMTTATAWPCVHHALWTGSFQTIMTHASIPDVASLAGRPTAARCENPSMVDEVKEAHCRDP